MSGTPVTQLLKIKVKLSLGPWGPIRLRDTKASTFYRQSIIVGGEVVSLTCQLPFTPRARVRLEGLGELKNPMVSSGI
jgi:hypothetical protein